MTNPLSWLLGTSSVLLGLGLLWVNHQPDGVRGLYLVILCLAWCAGLFILRTRLRQINLVTIALAACILRFFGLWTEPFTSHDGLRYLADVAALLEGLNPLDIPYIEQPLEFRMRWPIFYEHQPYTSIYPPMALGLFAAAAAAGPLYAWWTWKALGLVVSISIVFMLRRQAENCPDVNPLYFWFALHPLVIVETTVAPHIDLFVIVPLLFWLFNRDNRPSSYTALALGIGALIKPTILLGGLAWMRPLSRRNVLVGSLLAGVLLCTFLTLRIMGIQAPLGADFGTFLNGWHFGSLLDTVIFWYDRPTPGAIRIAFFLFISALWITRLPKQEPLFYRFGDALCIALACSPVVFPWYLLILTPWIVRREFPIVGWWSASLLTYEVLDLFDLDTTWSPSSWPNQVTVIILILWALSRRTNSFMLGGPQ